MTRRIVWQDPRTGRRRLYGPIVGNEAEALETARKFLYRSFQGDEAMLVAKSVRIEEVK